MDASTGEVALHYSDIKDAEEPSDLRRRQRPRARRARWSAARAAPATGIADADLAYQYFGDTYDFYFTRFGRDSFDGAGATLVGRVRYCEAEWYLPVPERLLERHRRCGSGQDYAAADDVVAHELTHARDRAGVEPHLLGRVGGDQRGPVRHLRRVRRPDELAAESTAPSVSVARWARTCPGGAIRSMSDPTLYGDPDRRFSLNWYTGSEDNRGVHFNSGVANKLAYLLVRRRHLQRPDGHRRRGSTTGRAALLRGAGEPARAGLRLLRPLRGAPPGGQEPRLDGSRAGQPSSGRAAPSRSTCRQPHTVFSDGFEGTFPGQLAGLRPGRRDRHRDRHAVGALAPTARPAAPRAPGAPPVAPRPRPPGATYKPLMDTWMVVRAVLAAATDEAPGPSSTSSSTSSTPTTRSSGASRRTDSTSTATPSRPGPTASPVGRDDATRAGRTSSSTSRRSRASSASRRSGSPSSSSPTTSRSTRAPTSTTS